MPPLWWSFLLSAVAVAGLYLISRKNPAGWGITFFDQLLWTLYSIDTRQYPFLVSTAAYVVVSVRGWLQWRRDASKIDPRP